jgi:DNA invertase Pin-like site-specific DNA recombinase
MVFEPLRKMETLTTDDLRGLAQQRSKQNNGSVEPLLRMIIILVELMRCLSNPTVNRPFHTVLTLLEEYHGRSEDRKIASGQRSAKSGGGVTTENKRSEPWTPPRRLSPLEISQLVERYQAGTKVRELAEEFGVHKHTVSAHLARRGIPTRIGGRVVDEAAALEIIRLYAGGQTMDAIAAELGIAQSTVSRALKEEGLH